MSSYGMSQMFLRNVFDSAKNQQAIECAGKFGLVSWTGAPLGGPYDTKDEAEVVAAQKQESSRIPVYVKQFPSRV